MKATAITHSNIALIKYWGKYNPKLSLPMNGSISMTLDNLKTVTTVEFSDDFKEDKIEINDKAVDKKSEERIVAHLDRIRKLAKIKSKAKMASKNNFPTATGLASSASGFSALTIAACNAVGLNLDGKQLSIISRQGSGSACRSIFGGFVEWLPAKRSEDSYAVQIVDENYFDLRDVIAIVSSAEKKVSSAAGMMETVKTSPIYKTRLKIVKNSLKGMKRAILGKSFTKLGKMAEFDCLLMHACMLTTRPPLIYWSPATIDIIHAIEGWRKDGLEAYYTIDAGPNVHILALSESVREIEKRLKDISGVIDIIQNKPGGGAKTTGEHLF